jgi:hypothetical protein
MMKANRTSVSIVYHLRSCLAQQRLWRFKAKASTVRKGNISIKSSF